jgi:redox-sensing transcriptional repressor
MEAALRNEAIDIAIVAVPAESAQPVVDRIVSSGVRAILNFAPTKLTVPSGVALKNVNMAVELEGLSYALANGGRAGRGARRGRAGSMKGTIPRNGAGPTRN